MMLAGAMYNPPITGKFFYAGLTYDTYRSYITLGVGDPKLEMNLLFNAEELTLAIFTKNCTNPNFGQACTVPHPYTPVNDTERIKNQTTEIAYLYQKDCGGDTCIGGIRKVDMSGQEAVISLNVTLPMFLREFTYTGHVFEVIQLI